MSDRPHAVLYGPTALEAERKALEDPAARALAAATRQAKAWNATAAQASIRDWPDAPRRVLAAGLGGLS